MSNERFQPTRRRALHLTGVAVAGALAGCAEDGGGDDGEAGGIVEDDEADATVAVGPGGTNVFDPEVASVAVGDTVVWEWEQDHHTVTPASTPEESDWEGEPEEHDARHTHEHTFDVAGQYEYYCEVHQGDGMEGEVVVAEEEAAESAE